MKYDCKLIGNRIRAERKKLGREWSQTKLGEEVGGYSYKTVGKWESGETMPALDDLLIMCNLFDCELGYLLCEYNCKSRTATDICMETGLTEEAIKLLHCRQRSFNELIENYETDDLGTDPFCDFISKFVLCSEDLAVWARNEYSINRTYEAIKTHTDFSKFYAAFKQSINFRKDADKYIYAFTQLNAEEIDTMYSVFCEEARKLNANLNEYEDEAGVIRNSYDIFRGIYDKYTQRQRYYSISDAFMEFIKIYVGDMGKL